MTSAGSCWVDAECRADEGADSRGDGVVSMACEKDGQCTCRLKHDALPQTIVQARFSAVCATDDDARALLLEHCMKGMHMAPPRTPSDEPPVERQD